MFNVTITHDEFVELIESRIKLQTIKNYIENADSYVNSDPIKLVLGVKDEKEEVTAE